MWKVKDEYAEHEITIRDQVIEIKTKAKNLTELELYNLSIRGIDLYYMFEEVDKPSMINEISREVVTNESVRVALESLKESIPNKKPIAYEGVEPDKGKKSKSKNK